MKASDHFLVCFSHGKESGPNGSKIQAMDAVARELNFDTISVDYRGIDEPEGRVDKLTHLLRNETRPVILVGSSMGSYVSLVASNIIHPAGLFLLAPAVYMKGYSSENINPNAGKSFIIHGWNDEIVPVENVICFAQKYNKRLLLCNDEHRLQNSLDLITNELRVFLMDIQDNN